MFSDSTSNLRDPSEPSTRDVTAARQGTAGLCREGNGSTQRLNYSTSEFQSSSCKYLNILVFLLYIVYTSVFIRKVQIVQVKLNLFQSRDIEQLTPS